MRGALPFDPDEYTYGEATLGVRRLLKDWAAIDWFVPQGGAPAQTRATRSYEEHHAAAHAAKPDVFGPKVALRVRLGGWKDFHALYEQVSDEVRYRKGEKGPSWDWKFQGLKDMTHAHSEARGFQLVDIAVELTEQRPVRPGDLCSRYQDSFIWNAIFPKLDLSERLPSFEATVGNWYVNFANQDLMEALEWQLAERSDDLTTNPFVPLMRVYAEGFYPFSLAPNEVVLFGFAAS